MSKLLIQLLLFLLFKFKNEKESQELPTAGYSKTLGILSKAGSDDCLEYLMFYYYPSVHSFGYRILTWFLNHWPKWGISKERPSEILSLRACFALNNLSKLFLMFNPSHSDLLQKRRKCKSPRQQRTNCQKNETVFSNRCSSVTRLSTQLSLQLPHSLSRKY